MTLNRFLFLSAFLFVSMGTQAQTASTICLNEVKVAFGSIDHEALLKSGKISKIEFGMSYLVRSSNDVKEREGKEVVIYAKDQAHRTGGDTEVYTDANEAFNYRPGQYAIYRTRSYLNKAGIIPKVDIGLLDMVTVKSCDFIPWEGNELAAKEAKMTVSEAGQKKYQIEKINLIYNPLDGILRNIHVEFTEKSLFKYADYSFTNINNDFQPEEAIKAVKDYFLDAEGKLLPKYSTCKMDDYR